LTPDSRPDSITASADQPARDGVEFAPTIAWNGCPRCVEYALGVLGPFDQQPFLRPGFRAQGVAVRWAQPQRGEAGGEVGKVREIQI
jgi:hypothetical protein